MTKTLDSLVSFTGGEVSPKIDARIDTAKYRTSMRQCLNMIPYKTGGLTRSPGSQMMAPAKLANTILHSYGVRLMPFIFSPTTSFIFEFGNKYVRFYSNGQQVNVTPGALPGWVNINAYTAGAFVQYLGVSYYCILSITANLNVPFNPPPNTDPTHWAAQTILEVFTPYSADAGTFSPFFTDVFQLAPCQINDVVYLATSRYAPYSLTRYSDIDWIMEQVPFLTPALLDQNATDTAIAANATKGNGVTLTASAPNWAASTYYTVGNSVTSGGVIYNCVTPNNSAATFAADLAAGFWVAVTIFNSLQIGSTWQITHLNNSSYLEVDGLAATGFSNGNSSTIEVIGGWEVHTYGVWSSDIAVQQSLDQGRTWNTVKVLTSRSDANFDVTGNAAVLSLYRFSITNSAALVGPTVIAGSFVTGATYVIVSIGSTDFTLIGAASNTVGLSFVATGPGTGDGTASSEGGGATNPRVVFSIDNAFIDGLVTITAVADAYHATANVVTQLLSTNATIYWSEAAWSNYRGFPKAVCTFQQRVIYGGSGFEPQRIWGTVTNDIENFDLGDQSLATDAFVFDLDAAGRGPIQWMIAQLDLFIGFSGAEWVVNSGSTNQNGLSSGSAITATNVNAVESSAWGSVAGVQPAIIGDAAMFTQLQGSSLRRMLFSIATDKYMTQDLTALADHLFSSGIIQISFVSRWHKQSIIYVVTAQGTLCGMTYELDGEIYGWHRRQTGYGQTDPNGNPIQPDNGFESIAVIPSQAGNDDEVWLVANRLIGGVKKRFIERLNPLNWEEIFFGAPNPPAPNLPQAYYVDCGKTYLNPGTVTLTGLDYLNGRYVVGIADGYAFGPLLVANGSITLPASIPSSVGTVNVGLPIKYAGQPMRLDVDPALGNTQGKNKAFDSQCYVRVWNSIGGEISNGTTQPAQWVSGFSYGVGQTVLSPSTELVYQCVVLINNSTIDPANDPAHWIQGEIPVYMPPVPIKYTPDNGNPFAGPVFVNTPTDKLVPPQLMPSTDHDPIFIIQGNDALPLTVLALILRPAISKEG